MVVDGTTETSFSLTDHDDCLFNPSEVKIEVHGKGGDDLICGGGANDLFHGDDGSDTLYGDDS